MVKIYDIKKNLYHIICSSQKTKIYRKDEKVMLSKVKKHFQDKKEARRQMYAEMDIVERQNYQAAQTMKWGNYITIGIMMIMAFSGAVLPTFATNNDAASDVQSILNTMIGYIGMAFQAVGVVLCVYSVGQLLLAFKNEDADSKSRASTMLVVGVILVAIKPLINGLNIVEKISSD